MYWSVHPAAGRTVVANQISDQTVQFTFDHDGSPVVISATCRASGLSFQRVAASPSPSPSR
jgi:hypothetical protein